ncbi:MAG: response regulator transcription factor [Pseudohongiella sp.]|nr:response regulator transcription factor [Pseudohongiella sp.]MDO9520347.1 response regulator transcription factor [Pseudohongiella sp.]MDP2126377.1 response regulator transcription factor [Pseudohongiella sp.]
MIRILVADDHAVVRRGICSLIGLTHDMELAGEAADSTQVLALIHHPDVSLLMVDMNMPGLSGLDLIGKVREQRPDLPILVLSMFTDNQMVEAALIAGANGYLSKSSDPDIIIAAARQCAAGGSYVDPAIAVSLILSQKKKPERTPHDKLSKRELQIMLMLASGDSVNRISEKLFVSPKTVSTHKFRIMQKLDLESIAELVRYALRHQLIDN